jgi:hypothetical protein
MSGWSTPPSDAHMTGAVIATYNCIAFDGATTRTWMQDREAILAARDPFRRILWPSQPLRILRTRPVV